MESPLSNFIKYKNQVDKVEFSSDRENLNKQLNSRLENLKKFSFNESLVEKLEKHKESIVESFDNLDILLEEFKQSTLDHVRQLEKKYMAESYRLYEEGSKDNAEYILDRSLFHSLIYRDEIKDYFKSRIKINSNWKYPGVCLRPEQGEYADTMLDSDPLYIVDETESLLGPVKKLWTKVLQGRIRYNLINENEKEIYKKFPRNQIGLFVAYNYFNYKPFEIIRLHLSAIYDIMRPGGTVIFTYNNCNLPLAVKNFEQALYTYTPGDLIIPALELIGFEIIENYNHEETNVSWLEIKKPGKLKSLKGGQSLASIDLK